MRRALAWLLYWMGDAVSRLMYDPVGGLLYPVYNRLMLWSEAVQGEGKGPWRPR